MVREDLNRKPERTGFKRKKKDGDVYKRKGEKDMPIDTSTIEGFDSMTAEQKVDALLKVEIPEKVDMTQFVPKDQADKFASEAAELKRQLRSKMTEDEAKTAQAEADRKDLETKYAELLRKSTVADHTAKFMALGYEEKLARETAEALFDGDMDKVFENQKKANEAAERKLRAAIVVQDPKPDGAGAAEMGESDLLKKAKEIGKEKAGSRKASEDVLNYYKV